MFCLLELQDEYSPLNLLPHAPSNGEGRQPQSNPYLDGGEIGEVDILRMVAECFNKYDNVNLEGCETNPSIHDGADNELVEAPVEDDGFPTIDNKGSDDKKEDNNDPMETRGTMTNINDPSGIALDNLL